jgi:GNAT superfamily N-acetyltransferase
MTDTAIRPYRPADHSVGRRLWVELTEQRRDFFADPGADQGAAFDEYLTRLDLSGVWVAEHGEEGVVGLVGLVMNGLAGRVEPVVVTGRFRGRGIGRDLLGHVAAEARRRGLARLTVNPDSRNVAAMRSVHGAGYDVLSAVELTLDLRSRPGDWQPGIELYGLRFRS